MQRRTVFAMMVGSSMADALNLPAISGVTADLLFVETDGDAIAPVDTGDSVALVAALRRRLPRS